jgi:hypothetical protein
MPNPFHDKLSDAFEGQCVTATSHDGETYTGWVPSSGIHHHDRHVLLKGAYRGTPGAPYQHVGTALVAHADTIHHAPSEFGQPEREHTPRIQRVPIDRLHASPYATKEFRRDANDNRAYLADAAEDGWVGSFPTVRLTHPLTSHSPASIVDDPPAYEVIEGNKRLWACREVGLESHPVKVIECSDWEAARRFVADHIPPKRSMNRHTDTQIDEAGREREVEHYTSHGNGWYPEAAIEASIRRLAEQWGECATDLPAVAFNIDRLGIELPESESEPIADGGDR